MKYRSVISFGDSTTAGCELIPNSVDWAATRKLSFPNKLADKLNIPCYNYAWPGGSNDRSLRLLPEILLEHPDSLVLFTYTFFDRTEFFIPNFKENNRYPDKNDQYLPVGINWLQVDTASRHKNLNILYLKNFHHSRLGFNNYKEYNMLLTVQLFCEKYSLNYLQIFLYPELISPPDFQSKSFDTIDKTHIYKFDTANDFSWETNNAGFGNLQQWAHWHGYNFCPGGHIGQDAHNNFANNLYQIFK
jgi:hypothetical protein